MNFVFVLAQRVSKVARSIFGFQKGGIANETKSVKKNEMKFGEENNKKESVEFPTLSLRYGVGIRNGRIPCGGGLSLANIRVLFSKFHKIPQKGQFNIMVGYIANFFGYKKREIKKGSFYTAPFSCYQNFLTSLRTFATASRKRATAQMVAAMC